MLSGKLIIRQINIVFWAQTWFQVEALGSRLCFAGTFAGRFRGLCSWRCWINLDAHSLPCSLERRAAHSQCEAQHSAFPCSSTSAGRRGSCPSQRDRKCLLGISEWGELGAPCLLGDLSTDVQSHTGQAPADTPTALGQTAESTNTWKWKQPQQHQTVPPRSFCQVV